MARTVQECCHPLHFLDGYPQLHLVVGRTHVSGAVGLKVRSARVAIPVLGKERFHHVPPSSVDALGDRALKPDDRVLILRDFDNVKPQLSRRYPLGLTPEQSPPRSQQQTHPPGTGTPAALPGVRAHRGDTFTRGKECPGEGEGSGMLIIPRHREKPASPCACECRGTWSSLGGVTTGARLMRGSACR